MHYHFRTRSASSTCCATATQLLEWAEVHGNFYGTPREPAEKALADGRDMLFDIDWQGAQQLREKMRADIVSIFILPPSMAELKARLQRRAEDSASTIETRLANARNEIEHWREYDYVVVNRDLDQAFRPGARHRHRRTPAPRPQSGPVRICLRPARRKDRLGRSGRAGRVKPREFLDRQRLRPACAVDARLLQKRLAAERLQALAQHLAALAEGGFGDAFQGAFMSHPSGISRGRSSTIDDVTFGGGVKACGGTSKAMRASVRHPAQDAQSAIGLAALEP